MQVVESKEYANMTPKQRARYNRAPRSKVIEVRDFLLNLANTVRDSRRNGLADYEMAGICEGCIEKANILDEVLEGM